MAAELFPELLDLGDRPVDFLLPDVMIAPRVQLIGRLAHISAPYVLYGHLIEMREHLLIEVAVTPGRTVIGVNLPKGYRGLLGLGILQSQIGLNRFLPLLWRLRGLIHSPVNVGR